MKYFSILLFSVISHEDSYSLPWQQISFWFDFTKKFCQKMNIEFHQMPFHAYIHVGGNDKIFSVNLTKYLILNI